MDDSKYNDIISKYKVENPVNNNKDHLQTFDIKNDVTGESTGEGKISDYIDLFNDRYDKIMPIIESKMTRVVDVRQLNSKSLFNSEVSVIGIVNHIRDTKNGNKLIEFEDPTGKNKVVYTDEDIKEQIESIVHDEIIGINGTLADDGGIIFGDELVLPDIPKYSAETDKRYDDLEEKHKAVLISDIHVGAELFAGEQWKKFVNWVNDNKDIKYILNAGDYLDGVGVYPDQQEELEIESIYYQNKAYADLLDQIRDDITIINIMGNHEPVRLAEPQPAEVNDYKELYEDNVYFTANPSMIEVEGVNFLLYHGASLQLLPDKIPGIDMENPEEVMTELLKKRHMSPVYGNKVRIAPEKKDYLVIDEIPDIFHTGHVHLVGQNTYNNVKNVNTGCWQYQTQFQKRKNIDPDVGYCMLVDLEDKSTDMRRF